MEYTDFKRFIFENKIKQSFLAKYLDVTEGYISNVAGGRKELSKENLGKVLNNPYGWDTSMLTQPENPMANEPKADGLVEYLERKVSDQEVLIRELYQQIGMLEAKLDLARKGEIARVVGGSSDADAV